MRERSLRHCLPAGLLLLGGLLSMLACNAKERRRDAAAPDQTSTPGVIELPKDSERVYLDELLVMVSTFNQAPASYGEDCRELEWPEIVKKLHRERSDKALPDTLATIVLYYERISTQKKGSCSKLANDAWSCSLLIADGKEFAIQVDFFLSADAKLLPQSMKCVYAG